MIRLSRFWVLAAIAGVAAPLLLGPSPTRAAILPISSPSEVPNPKTVQDFDSAPTGGPVAPLLFWDGGSDTGFKFLDVGGLSIVEIGPGKQVLDADTASIEILFNTPVNAVGVLLEVFIPPHTVHFEAYSSEFGGFLGSTTLDDDGFFGLWDDTGAKSIKRIVVHNGGFRFDIDDLNYGGPLSMVPLPGAVLLGALGLGVVAIVRRRTR